MNILSDRLPIPASQELPPRPQGKLTHEYVVAFFKSQGYELLAPYAGAHGKLEYRCPQGHVDSMAWTNFQRGKRCPFCMGKKITTEMVQAAFEAEGYQLLDEYRRSADLLRFVCPKGHRHQIGWASFNSGVRCTYCSKHKRHPGEVRAYVESRGFKLTENPERPKGRVALICPEGHEVDVGWSRFVQGGGCVHCLPVVTVERVTKAVEERGYALESFEGGAKSPLVLNCPKGHRWETCWDVFQRGGNCYACAGQDLDPAIPRAAFESEGYTVLSDYERWETKMRFICPEGHEHAMKWGKFKAGQRCGACKALNPQEAVDLFKAEGYELLDEWNHSAQKLRYVCPNGHSGSMTLGNFRGGKRCPDCQQLVFKNNSPAIVYYIRFDTPEGPLYKIGITGKTVAIRFGGEPMPYKILNIWKHRRGKDARKQEFEILREHREHRYDGSILRDGNTECFRLDVLGLDVYGRIQKKKIKR